MVTQCPGAPPVLSTPDTHILDVVNPTVVAASNQASDEEICTRFEIQKTLSEIRKHSWRRIALQFPDEMLRDSTRVFHLLSRGIQGDSASHRTFDNEPTDVSSADNDISKQTSELCLEGNKSAVKLSILADTSYGSCCVDEIAAEHLDADAVVHYGRACLSPTARLPVIHVFTRQSLDCEGVLHSFKHSFPDKSVKIILTADVIYAHHVPAVYDELLRSGYESTFAAEIIHDPASPVPNRTVPQEVFKRPGQLKQWRLFHISEPPPSLLLTLSSRLSEIRIYPTDHQTNFEDMTKSVVANTSLILRRRYALITSMTTVSTWGILINTLSVKNYLHIVDHVRSQIAAGGKKSYLFVVGKLNAAKVANFSEIGGWVVIGCWESSLVDSKDFYKPVITPFELELALQRDEDRVWTGVWSAEFQNILDKSTLVKPDQGFENLQDGEAGTQGDRGYDSEDESLPPEFDLRSGRYVSQTRPMQTAPAGSIESSRRHGAPRSFALTKRGTGAEMTVNGVASPAAQFLQSSRTWKGLGSDLEIGYESEKESPGASIQEGRSGIAGGYVVGTGGPRT